VGFIGDIVDSFEFYGPPINFKRWLRGKEKPAMALSFVRIHSDAQIRKLSVPPVELKKNVSRSKRLKESA
jgi:hypothetical protein